jgi:hypothetical protein
MEAGIFTEMLVVRFSKNSRHQIAEYLLAKIKYHLEILHFNAPVSIFVTSPFIRLPISISNLIAYP